jgi:hypothetical protein
MHLSHIPVADIPGLAWCLHVHGGRAEVLHGSRVEVQDGFFTDGVWAGDFQAGHFDRHFMCGTGVIVGKSTLTIASSSTPMDRVFTTRIRGELFASNSLPFLLAVIEDALDERTVSYRSLFVGTIAGLRIAPRTFTTRRGRKVRVLLGETASVNARGEIVPRLRPLERAFTDFADYRAHLAATVKSLIENATSPARRFRYGPLVSLSAGYDSAAVAVLVREAGGQEAVTMLRYAPGTRELVDYPGKIAEKLGLVLHPMERGTWRDRTDLPDAEIAAAATNFIEIPMLALEERLPGRMLFVGHSGDNVWTRDNFRHYRDIVRGDTSGQGLAEYRLRVGFVHCPVPYIGHTSHPSLNRVANSAEMAPWSVGGHYDRPIARRIIEEAGIARGEFATRKYAGGALVGTSARKFRPADPSVMYTEMREFMTAAGAASFVDYCVAAERSRDAVKLRVGAAAHWLYGKLNAVNYRIGRRFHRIGVKGLIPRRLMVKLASRFSMYPDYTYLLPHWGTALIKARYQEALSEELAARAASPGGAAAEAAGLTTAAS